MYKERKSRKLFGEPAPPSFPPSPPSPPPPPTRLLRHCICYRKFMVSLTKLQINFLRRCSVLYFFCPTFYSYSFNLHYISNEKSKGIPPYRKRCNNAVILTISACLFHFPSYYNFIDNYAVKYESLFKLNKSWAFGWAE